MQPHIFCCQLLLLCFGHLILGLQHLQPVFNLTSDLLNQLVAVDLLVDVLFELHFLLEQEDLQDSTNKLERG